MDPAWPIVTSPLAAPALSSVKCADQLASPNAPGVPAAVTETRLASKSSVNTAGPAVIASSLGVVPIAASNVVRSASTSATRLVALATTA